MYKLALLVSVAIFLSGFTFGAGVSPVYAQSNQEKCDKGCKKYSGGDTRGREYGTCMSKCLSRKGSAVR